MRGLHKPIKQLTEEVIGFAMKVTDPRPRFLESVYQKPWLWS